MQTLLCVCVLFVCLYVMYAKCINVNCSVSASSIHNNLYLHAVWWAADVILLLLLGSPSVHFHALEHHFGFVFRGQKWPISLQQLPQRLGIVVEVFVETFEYFRDACLVSSPNPQFDRCIDSAPFWCSPYAFQHFVGFLRDLVSPELDQTIYKPIESRGKYTVYLF